VAGYRYARCARLAGGGRDVRGNPGAGAGMQGRLFRDDGFLGIKGVYAAYDYCNIAILSWLYGEVFINDSVGIFQGCVNTCLLLRPARWPFDLA